MKLTTCAIIAFLISTIIYAFQPRGFFDDEIRYRVDCRRKLFMLLLPFVFFQGFRTVTYYSDNVSYWNDYLYHSFTLSDALNAPKDGGWYIFQMLLQKISSNPRFLMIALAVLFALAFVMFVTRVSDKKWLLLFLFVCFGLWKFQFSAMRQCTAIMLCMIAIKYVEEKKPVKFYLLILLAYTIHATAIIFIPVYFVRFLSDTKRDRTIMIIAAIVVSALSSSIFMWVSQNVADYERYAIDYSDNGGNIFAIIAIVITVFSEINRKGLLESKPGLLPYMYLNFVFTCICILRIKFPMLERLKFYYIPFAIIVFAESLEFYAQTHEKGKYVEMAALVLSFAYFLVNTQGYSYELCM